MIPIWGTKGPSTRPRCIGAAISRTLIQSIINQSIKGSKGETRIRYSDIQSEDANKLEGWGKIQGENPNRLASLENSDDSASINNTWDNFGGNIRIRAEERLDSSNGGIIRDVLTNNVQNLQVKKCRLNFHGYRIQAKAVQLF
jgi:hypothetical protein